MGEWGTGREIEKDSVLYRVERLHEFPSLINECCDLINLEWKRSQVARMRSIENSSENFPMSLLLIRNTGKTKVVGHCKVSKLPFSDTKVFLEIVVIHPDLRGKGLGRFLMEECEKVCKSKNISCIYLTTIDKEKFYQKLGYIRCPPITIYGSHIPESNEIELNFNKVESKPVKPCVISSAAPPPPPPPPPLSSFNSVNSSHITVSATKCFMKKELCT